MARWYREVEHPADGIIFISLLQSAPLSHEPSIRSCFFRWLHFLRPVNSPSTVRAETLHTHFSPIDLPLEWTRAIPCKMQSPNELPSTKEPSKLNPASPQLLPEEKDGGVPMTPANVKRKKALQSAAFKSPTDSFLSPCSRLLNRKT